MPCSVYCLVPDADQLEPLVDRLREAGVNTRDILVVDRGGQRWGPYASRESDCPCPLLHTFWQLQLAPAVWWWPLAVGELVAGRAARTRGSNEIISLAAYKRKRLVGGE